MRINLINGGTILIYACADFLWPAQVFLLYKNINFYIVTEIQMAEVLNYLCYGLDEKVKRFLSTFEQRGILLIKRGGYGYACFDCGG